MNSAHEIEDGKQWTAENWYTIARALDALAANKSLPPRFRSWLRARAEAAWVTGDWRNGISPAMWEAECAVYQAEDDAMVARRNANTTEPAQFEFEMA